MPTIQKLPLGRLQTNCYILCENPEDGVVVIDPGDDILLLQAALADFGVKRLGYEELDAPAMTDAVRNCAEDRLPAVPATHLVHEGDVLHLAGMTFTVMHTPGHTPGGVCYQCGDDLFTGDTLFAPGYGRTDLPGGSWSDLVRSLRRLLHLPSNLHVYPGHGGDAELFALRGNL